MSRAATSRLKVNAPLGLRPSLEYRPLPQLRIDMSYQRAIDAPGSQTLIRRIAQFWDWGLCQPLVVAKRADGSLMVVDGQHRLAAARIRNDIYDLPCVVTAYDSAGDEAAAFVALNQSRRPLGKLDLFKAALSAEDKEAVEIAAIVAAAGLSLAPHTNPTAWKPGMVSNVGGIENSFRRWGGEITLAALKALRGGFEDQVLRFAGTIFPGIANFIGERAAEKKPVEHDLLVLVLQGSEQREWVQEIQLEMAASGSRRQVAAMAAVRRSYEEAETEALDEAA